ncbi:hypothetical protein GLOTRDRAFT_92799 [Gloeophyllum trabeum ATCC 11539]|uniref:Uncharacterized protein n=1 Tax=Gloeophyllum trabeum (strain ATCC 11539 / FP-39264 / Madison 617) TaxID=670483 RepID=S7Q8I5_GLOTA|nr:uncharacterized protein GLOTRDRAFT_92799 [Gloeophyllum trabeum ATCC 11539]EPQ56296.1 hypothetical protein GLOTRDRAFT_92799 [Gloeophyllum trabeum ATCC 11539]
MQPMRAQFYDSVPMHDADIVLVYPQSHVPKRYQKYVSPSVRRVYLDEHSDEDLQRKITDVEARLAQVTKEKMELRKQLDEYTAKTAQEQVKCKGQCQAYQMAVVQHQQAQGCARLEISELRHKKNVLERKYRILEERRENDMKEARERLQEELRKALEEERAKRAEVAMRLSNHIESLLTMLTEERNAHERLRLSQEGSIRRLSAQLSESKSLKRKRSLTLPESQDTEEEEESAPKRRAIRPTPLSRQHIEFLPIPTRRSERLSESPARIQLESGWEEALAALGHQPGSISGLTRFRSAIRGLCGESQ